MKHINNTQSWQHLYGTVFKDFSLSLRSNSSAFQVIKCSKISICERFRSFFPTIYWQHCFVSETILPMCFYLSISPCPLHLPVKRIFQSTSQLFYDSNHRLSITCKTKSRHITSKSVSWHQVLLLSYCTVTSICHFRHQTMWSHQTHGNYLGICTFKFGGNLKGQPLYTGGLKDRFDCIA